MARELEHSGFADALRQWRRRRRVSQLELARRAATSQRHVSFIESGRSVPGRAMVVRLAEALEVPLRDRNALLLAAGYAPAYQETRFDDPKLDPVRTALARILQGHLPYPAVIVDRHGDLVSANDAFWVLTDAHQAGAGDTAATLSCGSSGSRSSSYAAAPQQRVRSQRSPLSHARRGSWSSLSMSGTRSITDTLPLRQFGAEAVTGMSSAAECISAWLSGGCRDLSRHQIRPREAVSMCQSARPRYGSQCPISGWL